MEKYGLRGVVRSRNMVLLVVRDGKWGAVAGDGRIVIPFHYDLLLDFAEGLAPFQRTLDGSFGYLDETGAIRIEERFAFASPFSDGVAAVEQPDFTGSGYIDPTGAWAIEPIFERANDFAGGRAAARSKGTWGLIDRRGAFVVRPKWQEVGIGDHERLPVRVGKKWGLVDLEGAERAPARYVEMGVAANGRVAFRRGKLWGFLDYDGNEVIAPRYARRSSFTDAGLASIELDGAWGVIDRDGATVIAFEHDELGTALEQRISFRKGSERGFYDLAGRIVFRGDWSQITSFQSGIAIADGRVLYDPNGRVVAEIDVASAPEPAAPTKRAGLGVDVSKFGPFFTAALETIGAGGRPPNADVVGAIDESFPATLKAYLHVVATQPYFFMSCFQVAPRALRFQVSKRRVRIGTGAYESEIWAEWSRRGEALIVEIVPSEEVGVPDTKKPWGTFESFFQLLWEQQLGRGTPCDPQESDTHRTFASALARAQARSD